MTKQHLLRKLRINGRPVKMMGNQIVFDTILEESEPKNVQPEVSEEGTKEKDDGSTTTR